MPFGAEVRGDGSVRFRLWAPAASNVDLCLQRHDGEALLPMTRKESGWFDLVTDLASPGSRYRFRIDRDIRVPDPASRYQPDDVHGASEVIDPGAWDWSDRDWRGRRWEEAVFYELHVGTFTSAGTFAGIVERLDYLVGIGVTAVELMPLADFPGGRNWGYDGVYGYAPDASYGRPEELKSLVEQAHARGLMVFLDVVYNHFGPEGNYLHRYAPLFFSERHHTPWGMAINFDGPGSRVVRDFFIHNALYWLEEYHFDGLRLDAVHAIADDSVPDILIELAEVVAQGPGRTRQVHLVLENDHNAAHYLARDKRSRPRWYVAQWNDDLHHALHVLTTRETSGYYIDYADGPLRHLGRCLTEGFAYQGESSRYRSGASRGESSKGLPLTAFVAFLQNHDQVGNRAFGERITRMADEAAVRAVTAVLLLAPSPPLLFMGQEWGSRRPFLFFCDFGGDLAAAVTEGRWREFAHFPQFSDEAARRRIPDPNAIETFQQAKLDWELLSEASHHEWRAFHQKLLSRRRRHIVPRLSDLRGGAADFSPLGDSGLRVRWTLGDGARLTLLANLGETPLVGVEWPPGRPIYPDGVTRAALTASNEMPPWTVYWFLQPNAGLAP